MDVFAVDTTTGTEHAVDVDADDTLAALRTHLSRAVGLPQGHSVELSLDGVDLDAPDTTPLSELDVCIESGCRIHVSPTGDHYTAALSNGTLPLASLPEWARLKRTCVAAALSSGYAPREPLVPPTFWGDLDLMTAATHRDSACFCLTPQHLRSERTLAEAALTQDVTLYWLVGSRLRCDPQIALQSLGSYPGVLLSDLPEVFWADKAFFLAAAAKSPSALAGHLRFAGHALRSDKEAVLVAVRCDPTSLQYAAEPLRRDREVVLAAADSSARLRTIVTSCRGECGVAYASPAALADPDMMAAVAAASIGCLRHADPKLRASKSFALRLLREQGTGQSRSSSGHILQYFDDAVRCDREVALAAAEGGGLRAGHPLLGDRGFALEALQRGIRVFGRLTEELRGDRELALLAVGSDGRSLAEVAPELQADVGVVRAALECPRGGGCPRLSFARGEAREDRGLVVAAVRGCSANFRYAPEALRRDKAVALEAVKGDPALFALLCTALRRDPEVKAACAAHGAAAAAVSQGVQQPSGGGGGGGRDDPRPDNKAEVLEAVGFDPRHFARAAPALQRDSEVAVAAVTGDLSIYWGLHRSLRHDLLVVSAALSCGMRLQDLDEALCGSKRVVHEALQHRSDEYRFATPALRADRAFALEVFPAHGRALRFASAALRDDRKVVLAAMSSDPTALRGASARLRSDKALALPAVQADSALLEDLDRTLRRDREVVLVALGKCCAECGVIYHGVFPPCADLLRHVGTALRSDREVVCAAVARHSDALQHAGSAMRCDTAVLVAAVSSATTRSNPDEAPSRDITGLRHAARTALGDRGTMAAVVQAEPWAMAYASPELCADKAFVLPLLALGQGVARHVHPSLLGDREVALAMGRAGTIPPSHPLLCDVAFVRQAGGDAFLLAPPEVRSDVKAALRAFAVPGKAGLTLNHVTGAARANKQVAGVAVRQCALNTRYLCDALRDDRDVALDVLHSDMAFFRWLGETVRNDTDVVLAAVTGEARNFAFAGDVARGDKRVALAAMRACLRGTDAELLHYASWDLQADMEVAVAAVQANRQNIDHVDRSLRDDPDFAAIVALDGGEARDRRRSRRVAT